MRDESRAVAQEILDERERQTQEEGWTPRHDDFHTSGELAMAAAAYALEAAHPYPAGLGFPEVKPVAFWPWDPSDFRDSGARRNLIKAGALIIAEIERLDRAQRDPSSDPH